jgi:hypothetical protein
MAGCHTCTVDDSANDGEFAKGRDGAGEAHRSGNPKILHAIVRIDQSRVGALKTAKQLVREIGLAVEPPHGVAIVLTEQPGSEPNWVAAASVMEAALTVKFSDKVAELMNTAPNVDWGDLDQGPGEPRRVVTFLSEETD